MKKYELSFSYIWHIDNGYGCKSKKKEHCSQTKWFQNETEAMKYLRKDIVEQLEELPEVIHIRNGIVIAGMDDNYNDIITITNMEVEEIAPMKYGVLYDSPHTCDIIGKWQTIEEAQRELDWCLDSELENAIEDSCETEIEYDSDGLGFLITAFSESNDRYWEVTCRIVELDENENYVEED